MDFIMEWILGFIIVGLLLFHLGVITRKKDTYTLEFVRGYDSKDFIEKIKEIQEYRHSLDEDIVKSAVHLYHREFFKKIKTDEQFTNFDFLYKEFMNSDYQDKKYLLLTMPSEYKSKILKDLVEKNII